MSKKRGKPKFKVGDWVRAKKPDNYADYKGQITKIEKSVIPGESWFYWIERIGKPSAYYGSDYAPQRHLKLDPKQQNINKIKDFLND